MDCNPLVVGVDNKCCFPKSSLLLKSTMIPRWSEFVLVQNGSYVDRLMSGRSDREQSP